MRGLVRAEAINREIDEEVQFHLDLRTAENIHLEMPPGFWPTGSALPRIWIPYPFSAEERTDYKNRRWNVIAGRQTSNRFGGGHRELLS